MRLDELFKSGPYEYCEVMCSYAARPAASTNPVIRRGEDKAHELVNLSTTPIRFDGTIYFNFGINFLSKPKETGGVAFARERVVHYE